MLLNIISDLHLDINNTIDLDEKLYDLGSDVVNIIAGDINPNIEDKINFLSKKFSGKIIFVNGNHDYYHHDIKNDTLKYKTIKYIQENNINNIVFLEKDTFFIDNVRIIGCTLWTDFNLYNTPVYSKFQIEKKINDYNNIFYDEKKIKTENIEEENRNSVNFLVSELNKKWVGKTIVVTHHAPLPDSLSINFFGNKLNPAFASDFGNIIDHYFPDIWIHGHIHSFSNYFRNKTRIVCNPYGYDHENTGYRYPFVIEI